MIQAIVKKGMVVGENVPAPVVSKGAVLIKVINSCISAGTEMSGVVSSGKSLISKALEQPANITKAMNMVRSEGIASAYNKVKGKLDSGFPTGYSISGIVLGVGEGVNRFKPGDRVAAAGAGLANHAEYVDVPEQLVMPMPSGLGFSDASTVTLGGIAMHGVRRAGISFGEFAVVVGAGILGLISVQLLRNSGTRVIVVDIDSSRLDIAKELGADVIVNPKLDDPVKVVENATNGYGADAVIFTAATSSSEPLSQAFKMCKKKGRVILVGVAGMEIKREDIYAKELDFLVSTSYGPGRYDKSYEEKGLDYPYSYVRWTENRNMEEYLRLVNNGVVKLEKLINQIFPISRVTEAFESLKSPELRPLMVLLDYGQPDETKLNEYLNHERKISTGYVQINKEIINVAMVGVGGFATGVHLPNILKLKEMYKLYAVMDMTGHKAKVIAEQNNAAYATTNFEEIISDPKIDLVLISTRHDSHADLALRALKAGKNVFVEKPLAASKEDLDKIRDFYRINSSSTKPLLMVGFNRRFSKYLTEIKKHTDRRINPMMIRYRMNAGYIPQDHWVHEHGGRMVGEACHIIDVMTFLTSGKIVSISCESLSPKTQKFNQSDNKTISLKYDDGSVCCIDYFSVGNKMLSKERMEIHFDEKSIILDDYKSLEGFGVSLKKIVSEVSDKGHKEELEMLYSSLKNQKQSWPIELWDMIQTTEATFVINQ